ncbi:beta-N-acetylhexosaminidase [Parashewanella spongiae]|uniref:beta-N-acetylhexosaminidase n=2 Tax=Parashewanella spongiae TaxID=342950 RepID=A0A3A6TCI1_9GAMM|nr:beta-N-acetylhexosaminidase [Parashewanella spongiae]
MCLSKNLPMRLAISLVIVTGAHAQTSVNQKEQPIGSLTQERALTSQETLHQFAQYLDIKYQLISNYPEQICDSEKKDKRCFLVRISFTPKHDFIAKNWRIIFSQMRPVKKVLSNDFGIKIIQGDLNEIIPREHFSGFKADNTYHLDFLAEHWQLAESDAMPNYYIVAGNLKPEIIASTQLNYDLQTQLEVRPYAPAFNDLEVQYKRSKTDKLPYDGAKQVFKDNRDIKAIPTKIQGQILPTPKRLKINQSQMVSLANGLFFDYQNLSKKVKPEDLDPAIKRLQVLGVKQNEKGIVVRFKTNPMLVPESYQLTVTPKLITIYGKDAASYSYGLSSIASAVHLSSLSLPEMVIEDSPRYEFRGMHLDVSRNFRSKEYVLKLLDQMAAYKLNALHLHMADDEGWRLQIQDLPELTQVGSRRCHDLTESRCLLPQLGSGPDDKANPDVNGFYSKQDYIEILTYAAARQIQVIPSMDMPGHSRAAIRSMEARYRNLMAKNQPEEAEMYRLLDPLDKTEYRSVQYYNDNTLNVCLPSTYAFVDKVIEEITRLHEQAGAPLAIYHIGADETAGAWLNSPACEGFVANRNNGIEDKSQLGAYFIERIANMLDDKGIKAAGWSDGLGHVNPEKMPNSVHTNLWDILSHGGHKNVHNQLALGWDAVLSTPDVLYFDMPSAADPREHGYYWASRKTNSRQIHSFMPDNLPANAEQWRDIENKPYQADDRLEKKVGKFANQPKERKHHVAGLQGQLWTETIRSDVMADSMIYPRMLLLAEKAWHKPQWEVPYDYGGLLYNAESEYFTPFAREQQRTDWQRIANHLGHNELAKLELQGVIYRLPPPGAKIINGKLHANVSFPGLEIQFKLPGKDWQTYTNPISVKAPVELRSVSHLGNRASRSQFIEE